MTFCGRNTKSFSERRIRVPSQLTVNPFCSNYQMGLLASVPAPGFIFLSADALATKQDVASWAARAHANNTQVLDKVVAPLRPGLEKQFEVQKRLFADKTQPQGE